MQSVYRVIMRDYKDSYDYFTQRKDVFDLFASSDGLDSPEVPEEMAEKYGIDADCGAWEFLDEIEKPTYPYIILGEATQFLL